jgi:hypothetical protein
LDDEALATATAAKMTIGYFVIKYSLPLEFGIIFLSRE